MSWMTPAWASAVSSDQTWAGVTTRSVDGLCSLIEHFPKRNTQCRNDGDDLTEDRARPGGGGGREQASADGLEPCDRGQEDLTEAVEIQEVIGPRWWINLGQGEIIGAAQGDGGMPAVGGVG